MFIDIVYHTIINIYLLRKWWGKIAMKIKNLLRAWKRKSFIAVDSQQRGDLNFCVRGTPPQVCLHEEAGNQCWEGEIRDGRRRNLSLCLWWDVCYLIEGQWAAGGVQSKFILFDVAVIPLCNNNLCPVRTGAKCRRFTIAFWMVHIEGGGGEEEEETIAVQIGPTHNSQLSLAGLTHPWTAILLWHNPCFGGFFIFR